MTVTVEYKVAYSIYIQTLVVSQSISYTLYGYEIVDCLEIGAKLETNIIDCAFRRMKS